MQLSASGSAGTLPRYLEVIASALEARVAPHLTDSSAQEIATCSARTLRALCLLFETSSSECDVPNIPELLDGKDGTAHALLGLPENLVVSECDAAAVQAAAQFISKMPWPDDPDSSRRVLELVRWESHRVATLNQRIFHPPHVGGLRDITHGFTRAVIENYLGRCLDGSDPIRVTDFKIASGGKGKLTVLFSQEGATQIPTRLVLRADHPSIGQGRSVVSEFAILSTIHSRGVKVPRPFLLETSPEVIGSSFMIMEQMPGTVPGGFQAYFDPPRSESLALNLARELGRLHNIVPDDLPQHARTAAPQLPLSTLLANWRARKRADSIAISAALSWMQSNIGRLDDRRCIVHGDLQLHNVLSENHQVTSLLDWEYAHVGHPAEDLGYVKPAIERMTSWDRFMAVYRSAGGHEVTELEVDYYSLASVLQIISDAQFARQQLEQGYTDDAYMAFVGCCFIPQLLERLSLLVTAILDRGIAAHAQQ